MKPVLSLNTERKPGSYRYLCLADELENNIRSGVYKAGDRLPSLRKLHVQTRLSISTVYQAYIELEKRSLITARYKSGYFVRPAAGPLLPAPALKTYRPSPQKVTINTLAGSIVKAMGDRRFLQLGGTLIAPSLLPLKSLQRSLRALGPAKLEETIATYASPHGLATLRREIAKRSLAFFQGTVAEDMIITNGCIEAVSLCLQAVAAPGDTIVVESPTYPWFLQIIEDLNMLALEIPTDPLTGIDIDSLARALETNPVKACLMIPNFHNPLGCVMPEANKQALVELLNQKEIPLIEDDIHGELFHTHQRPSTLKAYDRKGLVLYCSSFSKTLAPGLRVGWTLPGRFKRQVQKLKLNLTIASSALNQQILRAYLRDGAYDRHLRRLRTALKNQTDHMTRAIARYFPAGTRVTAPEGGLVLWVELGEHIDGLSIFNQAREHKIAIMPGCMCSTTDNYNNYVRLSCGWPWNRAIEKGMQTLGAIIAAHTQSGNQIVDNE